jgi:hypothetical protein
MYRDAGARPYKLLSDPTDVEREVIKDRNDALPSRKGNMRMRRYIEKLQER